MSESTYVPEGLNRSYQEVVTSISELARVYLDERKTYGEMRTGIKKRCAMVRLFLVNEMTDRLENPDVIDFVVKARTQKNKLTLDSINALIALEIGEDYDRYEEAKFNSQTSEKAFVMFQAELSAHQSQIKKDVSERENVEYAQRMTSQRGGVVSA